MERLFGKTRLVLAQGDITREAVDAVVNAANQSLLGGGGVDGAIHRAGGRAILEECRRLGGCRTGDAKITTGGNLDARYVIHTVGPVYRDGKSGEAELLAGCHRRSIEVALENKIRSMAFPAISCGVYGYPVPSAARIALGTVTDLLGAGVELDLVRFVLFGDSVYQHFAEALESIKEQDGP